AGVCPLTVFLTRHISLKNEDFCLIFRPGGGGDTRAGSAPSRQDRADPTSPSEKICCSGRAHEAPRTPCRPLVLGGLHVGLDGRTIGTQFGEGLVEDDLALLLATALLHVRQVGLDVRTIGWPVGEGLVEDDRARLLATALLHVRQVGLVRLGAWRRGGIGLVLAGGKATARAIPLVGNGGLAREAGHDLVQVRTVERNADARGGLAPLRLAHGAGSDPAATDGTATTHEKLLRRNRSPEGPGQARLRTGHLRRVPSTYNGATAPFPG